MGDLTLTLGATYVVDVGGAALGDHNSQSSVTGAVALSGARLALSLGLPIDAGMMFTIIENDHTDIINGIFDGLSEGAAFSVDGQTFTISYIGGSGNDVVLTAVVPEPRTWLLAITGALLLGARMLRQREH